MISPLYSREYMNKILLLCAINLIALHATDGESKKIEKHIPIQGGYAYDCSPRNIAKYLPKNPIVLECGAHDGADTVKMAKYWKNGIIYAIEANPYTYKTLEKNTKGLKNVKLFPIALGWNDEEADFYIAKHPDGIDTGLSSLLICNRTEHRPNCKYTFDEKVTVPVYKIDTWAKLNNITHIDFLWLDMQGADFNTIMESSEILDTVKLIKIEISTKDYYKGTVLYKEGTEFLESRGFTLIVDTDWEHSDAVFMRTTWLEELNL
jgi:FkbM family methyltransferase